MKNLYQKLVFALFLCVFAFQTTVYGQDNCATAVPITITGGGYDIGVFTGANVNLTGTTLQATEYTHPNQLSPDKSVWYRFSIPTARLVSILLAQPLGGPLSPDQAGWTLYRSPGFACLPTAGQVIEPSIVNIEGYTHRCLGPGDYLIQVTAELAAAAPIYVQLTVNHPDASETNWDFAGRPYNFGVPSDLLTPPALNPIYSVGCQTIFNGEGTCPTADYTQSTWHIFTTDAKVDFLRFEVGQNSPWDAVDRTWGYRLYRGDARQDSIADGIPAGTSDLTQITACKTLTQYNIFNVATNPQNQPGPYGFEIYPCDLEPNTTYSIQLYHPRTYNRFINLKMYERGSTTSLGGNPATLAPARQLGVLPTSISTTDVFSCEGRLDNFATCDTVVPAAGYLTVADASDPDNTRDTLDVQTWFTFTLATTTNVRFQQSVPARTPMPMLRLFQGDVTAGCGTLTLYEQQRSNDFELPCVPAGTYSVQLLGQSNWYHAHNNNATASNMSRSTTTTITIGSTYSTAFGLRGAAEFDAVNGGLPLADGIQYNSTVDTFDCSLTPLPAGVTTCGTGNDRAMYRVVQIDQNGVLYVNGGRRELYCQGVRYRLFRGNAATEAAVAPTYYGDGDLIPNLVDQAGCQELIWSCIIGWQRPFKVCVTPGYYTLVTYGNETVVGEWDRPWFRFEAHTPTMYADSLAPEIMPNLSAGGPAVSATASTWSCVDNAATFGGRAPCSNYPKAIYRQIEITSPLLITFTNQLGEPIDTDGSQIFRMYNGWKTDGSLGSVYRDCFTSFSNVCVPAGKYTIVAYGWGEDFITPTYTGNKGGTPNDLSDFTLTYDPDLQKYGTFATRDLEYRDAPLNWGPNPDHTAQIPHLDRTTTLDVENFDCGINTPFPAGVTPCQASHNRVSYRVFRILRPSYVYIDNIDYIFRSYESRLYRGDISTIPAAQIPDSIIQQCVTTPIRQCLQAGTYTLVTFAGDGDRGATLQPRIRLDSLADSQHDLANNAYDFGNIPTDNVEYRGNPSSPTDALGRPASTDFFMCTTGHHVNDVENNCGHATKGAAPAAPNPYNQLRNLWYTFTVTGPGRVYVNVKQRTPGSTGFWERPSFTVYQSLNSTYPLTEGNLAPAQLSEVATSTYDFGWCRQNETISFYIDPCSPPITRRYYVVVNMDANIEPDVQMDMGIRFEPAPPAYVLFDQYSGANIINANPTTQSADPYTQLDLTEGAWSGFLGNLNCATMDGTEPYRNDPITYPTPCGTKTLWYGFDVGITGRIRIHYDRPGATPTPLTGVFNANDVKLYRQIVPGDSTITGMEEVTLAAVTRNNNPYFNTGTNYQYGEGCASPGRYYILFTGCNFPTETVRPRIWLENTRGDLCTDPLGFSVVGTGTFTSPQATIDCHTIGDGPGEDQNYIFCKEQIPTAGKKSTWFRFNIDTTGVGKADMDITILNSSTSPSNMIAWRIGFGDCQSMTFDACVPSADVDSLAGGAYITQNLKCRVPATAGYYWVQAVTPESATGQLSLRIEMNSSSDQECFPIDPDAPRASFSYNYTCSGTAVSFNNLSTTGDSLTYHWDFGDGSPIDTTFSPTHLFVTPAYGTFMVKLVVSGPTGSDSLTRPVIVYQKPVASFTQSADTVCIGETVTFTSTAAELDPAADHLWQFCAGTTASPCGASTSSFNGLVPPAVSWSTPGLKIIQYTVDNLNGCDSIIYDTVLVAEPPRTDAGPDRTIICGDGALIGPMELNNNSWADMMVMPAAGVTDTTYQESGRMYDHGGVNYDYPNSSEGTRQILISPVGGTSVSITFTARGGGGEDRVRIYNGTTTSAPLLLDAAVTALPLNVPYTANSGKMLVSWVNSCCTEGLGFAASWTSTTLYSYTYSWAPAASVADPTSANTRAFPNSTTTYTLTKTNQFGCSSTDMVTITVNASDFAGPDKTISCGDSTAIGMWPLPAEFSMLSAANSRDTLRAPNGKIYDHGGANYNYPDGSEGTRWLIIAPNGADSVGITFNQRGGGGEDLISLFDGYDDTAPAIIQNVAVTAIPLGTLYKARSGVMAVRWVNQCCTEGLGFEATYQSWGSVPYTFSWSPATGLSDATSPTPMAAPAATTTYTVTYNNGCTDQVTVTVNPVPMAGPDRTITCGDSTYIGPWTPPSYYSMNAVNNRRDTTRAPSGYIYDHGGINYNYPDGSEGTRWFIIAPTGADSVILRFTARGGGGEDLISIFNGYDDTAPAILNNVAVTAIPLNSDIIATSGVMCIRWVNACCTEGLGFVGEWSSVGNIPPYTYSWSPTTGLSDPTSPTPRAAPAATTTYTLTYGGGCTDEVTVYVNAQQLAGPDKIIQCGDSTYIGAWVMPTYYSMPTAANQRDTTYAPEGYVYDHGGANYNYPDGSEGTRWFIISPTGADSVTLQFTARGGGGEDLISIFDGYDDTAPAILNNVAVTAIPLNTNLVARSGVMSIRWVNQCCTEGLGFAAQWTSAGNIPPYTYSWSPTAGLSDPTSPTPRAAPSATTTYTLTYGGGCTDAVTVTVRPLTLAGPDRTINCGDSVLIGMTTAADVAVISTVKDTSYAPTGILVDHGGINYNYPDGSEATRWYVIAPTGADSVVLQFIYGGGGGEDLISVFDGYDDTAPALLFNQAVTALPLTPLVARSGVMSVRWVNVCCTEGSGFRANWTSGGNLPPFVYSWSPTTGLSDPSSPSPKAAPSTTTTYTLTYNNGCTDQITVNVNPIPVSAGADYTIQCGDSVTLGSEQDTIVWHNEPVTYLPSGVFYDAGGPNSDYPQTDYNTLIAPPGATTVSFTFTSRSGGGEDQLAIFDGDNVQAPLIMPYTSINSVPIGTTYTATSGKMLVAFLEVCCTEGIGYSGYWSSTGGTPMTYSWSPTTGLSDPTSPTPRAAPGATTTYTLTKTSANGCVGTDQATVTVNPLSMYNWPNQTIMCGDGVKLAFNHNMTGTVNAENTDRSTWITTPSGYFYDVAGPSADYPNGSEGVRYHVIAPLGASQVTLQFHASGGGSEDVVTVYDGPLSTDPVLYSGTVNALTLNTPITSTGGVMLVRFNNQCCTEGSGWIASFTSDAPAFTYSWAPATGLSATNIAEPTAAPSATTTYTVTVTSPGGCTYNDQVTVTVNPLTNPAMTGAYTITCGQQVMLGTSVANASNTNLSSFERFNMPTTSATGTSGMRWSKDGKLYDNGGPLSTYAHSQDVYYTLAPLGATSVTLTFESGDGDGTAGDYIMLYDGPSSAYPVLMTATSLDALPIGTPISSTSGYLTVRFVSNATLRGDGFAASFTSTGANITYSWAPAAGLSATNVLNPIASPTATTVYTLTTTYGVCSTTTPVTVTVGAIPDLLGNYTMTCADPMMVGIDTVVYMSTYNDVSNSWYYLRSGRLYDRGGPNYDYEASFTDDYLIQPLGADTIYLRYSSVDGDGTAGDWMEIYDGVNTGGRVLLERTSIDLVPTNFTFKASSGAMYIRMGTDALNGQGAGFAANWWSTGSSITGFSWNPATALSATNISNPIASPTATTNYTMTVQTTGACANTTATQVAINNPNTLMGTYTISSVCGDSVQIGLNSEINSATITVDYLASGTFTHSKNDAVTGSYLPNEDFTTVFSPPGATSVTMTFSSANGDGTSAWNISDWIWIYDGTSTAAPLIWGGPLSSVPIGSPLVANSGSMAVRFRSNAAVQGTGWQASWTSTGATPLTYTWSPTTGLSNSSSLTPKASPAANTTYTLTVGTTPATCTRTWRWTINQQGAPVATDPTMYCGDTLTIGNPPLLRSEVYFANTTAERHASTGTLYDNGGPLGDYLHTDWTYLLSPIGATQTTLTFTSAAGDAADLIYIYNGTSTADPLLLGPVAANAIPLGVPLVASSGKILIRCDYNAGAITSVGAGFAATWTSDADPWTATWTTTATGTISSTTALTPRVWPTATSTYNVTYTNGTCNLTDAVVVTVNPDPTPMPAGNFAGTDASICPGGPGVTIGSVLPTYTFTYTNTTATTTTYADKGVIYDNGGAAGNYSGNYDSYLNIYPPGAAVIRITFTQGLFSENGDFVHIIDPISGTTLLNSAALAGFDVPAGTVVTSTSGRMQVRLRSDGDATVDAGITANWEVISPTTTGLVYWLPTTGLSDPNAQQPVATPTTTTTYTMYVGKPGCTQVNDVVTVTVTPTNVLDYRSVAAGNWSDINLWQVLSPGYPNTVNLLAPENEGFWVNASTYNGSGCGSAGVPDARSLNVFIRHLVDMDVTIPATVGVDQISIVEYGGFSGHLRIPAGQSLTLKSSGVLNKYSNRMEDIYNQARYEIAGTFALDGGQLFNEDTSTVDYSFAGDQQMWDGKYGRLEIHNGGEKHVTGNNSRVNTEVQFFLGYVTLDGYNITLAQNCATTGAGYTTGYFVTNALGSVVKENVGPAGVAGYKYWVGHSITSMNPATVTNAGTTDDYRVRVVGMFEYNPVFTNDVLTTPSAVDRTWHIEDSTAGGSDVTLRLDWITAHENASFDRTIARKTHYSSAIGWEWKSAPANSPGGGIYTDMWYYETPALVDFSPYTVGSFIEILNSDKLVLWGQLQGDDGLLQWEGENDPSIQHYELERRTAEPLSSTYQVINRQDAFGNNTPEYSYTDRNLPYGTYQYRVREYDWDGNTLLSNVVELYHGADNEVRLAVYPNPVTQGEVNLRIRSREDFSLRFEVVNALGQVVYVQDAGQLMGGSHTYHIPMQPLAAGTYTVRTSINGKVWNTRLVKLNQ